MSAGKVLIKTIRIQKYRFFDHIIKDKEVENMVIMGNGEGELRKTRTDVDYELEKLDNDMHQQNETDKSGTRLTKMESIVS